MLPAQLEPVADTAKTKGGAVDPLVAEMHRVRRLRLAVFLPALGVGLLVMVVLLLTMTNDPPAGAGGARNPGLGLLIVSPPLAALAIGWLVYRLIAKIRGIPL